MASNTTRTSGSLTKLAVWPTRDWVNACAGCGDLRL